MSDIDRRLLDRLHGKKALDDALAKEYARGFEDGANSKAARLYSEGFDAGFEAARGEECILPPSDTNGPMTIRRGKQPS